MRCRRRSSAPCCAPLLHARWNAIVKPGGDTLLTTIVATGWAAALSALALPRLPLPAPAPAPASWPWLAASAVLQVGCYALVAALIVAGAVLRRPG